MPTYRHEGTVMARFLNLLLLVPLLLVMTLLAGGHGHAASEKQPATQSQIEATILHVDKYGVYAPNLVFYWPPEMNKQKIAALTHTAEQLRNRKAVITYTSVAEIPKDRRPLLIDLVPSKEGGKPVKEDYTREDLNRDVKGPPADPKPLEAVQKSAPAQTASAPASPQGQPELRPLPDKYKLPAAEQSDSGSKPSSMDRQNTRPAASERTPQADAGVPQKPQRDVANSEKETEELRATAPLPIAKEDVAAFIRRILALTAKKDLNSILPYYADRVNYYDRGLVDLDYIRRDMGYYFKNWDTIACALDGDVVSIVTDQQDVRIVKFISTFSVRNSRKSISGRTENVWKIQRINNQLKIVEEKQRTLATEPRS